MKQEILKKGLLAAVLCTSLFGCAKEQEPVNVIIKVPTLSINCLEKPEITDSEDLLQYAVNKYQKANPQSKASYTIEVFEYVDEEDAIVNSYDTPDAVDLLYEGYFNMAGYMNHSRLVPLDDIISDEIRADISETSWTQSTKDVKR